MALSVLLLLACVTSGIATSNPRQQSIKSEQPSGKRLYNCDPTIPPACATNLTTTFCLEDEEYPTYEIKNAIKSDYLFPKKYADVFPQSADILVDMVTKEQEASFDYSYYTGDSKGDSPLDITHWSGPEGYICPSTPEYVNMRRAQNVEGEWRVIVNHVHDYTQTIRLETCLLPDSACRAIPACFNTHCTQKFMHHRMLSYDPCDPYRGLFIDIYKLPSACSCLTDEEH